MSDFIDMNVFENITSVNDDLRLTGNESFNELLDYMVLKLCRGVASNKAFKGGWMLTKLLQSKSRMTKDIDLSVSSPEAYAEVKETLREIAEEFKQVGIVDDYRIKENVTPSSSGGIDLYKDGEKILGADIGLHEISWGVKRYNLSLISLDGFEVERMLADKIIVILSRKRFRRTKDLYDFCILVRAFDFDLRKLRSYVDLRGGAEWDNIPFNDAVLEQYRKAWDKLVLVNSVTGDLMEKLNFEIYLQLFYAVVLPLKVEAFDYPIWDHNSCSLSV